MSTLRCPRPGKHGQALLRSSYAAGVEAARERNCNDYCNDADREQAS